MKLGRHKGLKIPRSLTLYRFDSGPGYQEIIGEKIDGDERPEQDDPDEDDVE